MAEPLHLAFYREASQGCRDCLAGTGQAQLQEADAGSSTIMPVLAVHCEMADHVVKPNLGAGSCSNDAQKWLSSPPQSLGVPHLKPGPGPDVPPPASGCASAQHPAGLHQHMVQQGSFLSILFASPWVNSPSPRSPASPPVPGFCLQPSGREPRAPGCPQRAQQLLVYHSGLCWQQRCGTPQGREDASGHGDWEWPHVTGLWAPSSQQDSVPTLLRMAES